MTQIPVQGASTDQGNTLGLAGFICSLVGLTTGGFLSPIGLILSLVALGREPRGFAIAGTIVGLLGSCGAILFIAMGGLALLGITALGAAIAVSERERIEMAIDAAMLNGALESWRERDGALPATLADLSLDGSTFTDPWGGTYRYVIDDGAAAGYRLFSDGPDRLPETADDVDLEKGVWDQHPPAEPPESAPPG